MHPLLLCLTRADPQLFQNRSNFCSRSFVMFSQINDSFVCACCGESKRAKKRRCIGGVAIAAAICLYKAFVNHLNGPFPLPACESCWAASKQVTHMLRWAACVHARNLQREAPSPNPGKPNDDNISSCPAAAGFLLCLHLDLATVMIFHCHAANTETLPTNSPLLGARAPVAS